MGFIDKTSMGDTYNVKWTTQAKNSGDSMPLGGGDVGCNVWVENGDILVYMAESGCFDEEGRMAKAGRLRIKINPNPFDEFFTQELKLHDGYIEIQGKISDAPVTVNLWVNVYSSSLNIEIKGETEFITECIYESWRAENSEFKNKDVIEANNDTVLFYHRNKESCMLNKRIAQQGIESIREHFPDVEKNRTFGGKLVCKSMSFCGNTDGTYGENVFKGYKFVSLKSSSHDIKVHLYQNQCDDLDDWFSGLNEREEKSLSHTWEDTKKWWHNFWDRSYVYIKKDCKDAKDKDFQTGRNYQLFRYMLGCNAYGEYPTKFNGGLFTVDPIHCERREGFGSVYPDDRDWGGLIFTAQNQRLVYWPMIRNGDFEMMKPQFEFYKRMLNGIKARTKFFFDVDDAAAYPEQLDANGLSAFYGDYGLDFPLQVRYHYVDAVEFGYMMLMYAKVSGADISEYIDYISSVINFYDLYYPKKDENGKRIIFPSTSLETYHKADNVPNCFNRSPKESNYNADEVAITNPSDVIAALHATLEELLNTDYGTDEQREGWRTLLNELPPIPKEIRHGYEVIAPCLEKEYVCINCEIPQLNTVYPYNMYGINKPEMELALNTYNYSWENEYHLMHISWHQNGIFAARLGQRLDARKYMWLKMADARRKFPAFWGPGHDYVPDHNWGGSGMIGVQEMLVQSFDEKIYILPAWQKNVDVEFKLWVNYNTCVEVKYIGGKLDVEVEPKERKKDIVICVEK